MNGPRIGSLCSGYRGLDAAVEAVFGGTTAWVSDIDPGASAILAHHWPQVPNLGNLTTVDWSAVEPVDIVCGGYPCQPFSDAGKRLGVNDERHIWPYIATALRVLRPRYAIFENVGGHLRRGFDTVLADLASIGFDAEWCTVRASEVGAPHPRRRLIILATPADPANLGHQRARSARDWRTGSADRDLAAPDTKRHGQQGQRGNAGADAERPAAPTFGCGLVGGGAVASDADGGRFEGHPERDSWAEDGQPEGQSGLDALGRGVRGEAPADTAGVGRGEGWPESARLEGRPGSPGGSAPDWGQYDAAIRRWEAVTGRAAPGAVDDRGRLSPAFVEWMMGLPAGHVTDVPGLSRNAMLKALGNGVVPQQAEAALRLLLARATSTAQAA